VLLTEVNGTHDKLTMLTTAVSCFWLVLQKLCVVFNFSLEIARLTNNCSCVCFSWRILKAGDW